MWGETAKITPEAGKNQQVSFDLQWFYVFAQLFYIVIVDNYEDCRCKYKDGDVEGLVSG